jgi:hypothetical protein
MKRFEDLVGKIITAVNSEDSDCVEFILSDGTKCQLYHEQDCCESVGIDETEGTLRDLIGEVITLATEDGESRPGDENRDNDYGSWTRSTYTLATASHKVMISWIGESNGYYSEDVNFYVDNTRTYH